MKPLYSLLAVAVLLVFPAASQAQAPARNDVPLDLVSELVKKGFNTLSSLLHDSGLAGKLSSEVLTLLAPTDNAFRELSKAQLDSLRADKAKLSALFSNHLIAGKLSSSELKSTKPKTLAGGPIVIKTVDGKVKINSATLVKPDIATTNGVIHGIDKVLQP